MSDDASDIAAMLMTKFPPKEPRQALNERRAREKSAGNAAKRRKTKTVQWNHNVTPEFKLDVKRRAMDLGYPSVIAFIQAACLSHNQRY